MKVDGPIAGGLWRGGHKGEERPRFVLLVGGHLVCLRTCKFAAFACVMWPYAAALADALASSVNAR